MIYLNVILTILCVILLSFLVFMILTLKKLSNHFLKLMSKPKINEPGANNIFSPDIMNNMMKEMIQNRMSK
jgi:hypothetical protein